MATKRSLIRAMDLVARYNRQTEQIRKTEARLRKLHEQRDRTRTAAFAALPEDTGIVMDDDGPWSVSVWR